MEFHDEHPSGAIHPAASMSSSLADVVARRKPGVSSAPGGIPSGPTGGNPISYRPPPAIDIGASNGGAGGGTSTTGTTSSTTTTTTNGSSPTDPLDELIQLAAAESAGGSGGSGDVAIPIQSDTTDGGDGSAPAASGGGSLKVGLLLGFFLALGWIGWHFRDKIFKHKGGAT